MLMTLPQPRDERWELLGRMIDRWYGSSERNGIDPVEIKAAEKGLDLRFPDALREWYEKFGNRREVWTRFNRMFTPAQARVDFNYHRRESFLVFYTEAQDVEQWGIGIPDLDKADPPVAMLDYDTDGFIANSVSEFAWDMFLFGTAMGEPAKEGGAGGYTWIKNEVVARICSDLEEIPSSHWRWPYPCILKYYGHFEHSIIKVYHAEEESQYVEAIFIDQTRFDRFSTQFDIQWEEVLN